MKIIDAHQHFWKYNKKDFDWISDDMQNIRKDFLPGELQIIYDENKIDGCIAVQVNQTEEENDLFLGFAENFDFIKGVVGWVDLVSDTIEEKLSGLHRFVKMKGFRHILQGEKNRSLMLTPAFKKGISLLEKFHFTYDILIFPDQLKYACELVRIFPRQKFVIDHLAKPSIKKGEISQWKNDIQQFSSCENVYCKISGLVTEADKENYSAKTFEPYLDIATETFGTKRMMFGSDWPVCLVAASYKKVLEIVKDYFSSFTVEEQEDVFYNNATGFYHL